MLRHHLSASNPANKARFLFAHVTIRLVCDLPWARVFQCRPTAVEVRGRAAILEPMEDRKRGELSHERIKSALYSQDWKQRGDAEASPPRWTSRDAATEIAPTPRSSLAYDELSPRPGVVCKNTLKEVCR